MAIVAVVVAMLSAAYRYGVHAYQSPHTQLQTCIVHPDHASKICTANLPLVQPTPAPPRAVLNVRTSPTEFLTIIDFLTRYGSTWIRRSSGLDTTLTCFGRPQTLSRPNGGTGGGTGLSPSLKPNPSGGRHSVLVERSVRRPLRIDEPAAQLHGLSAKRGLSPPPDPVDVDGATLCLLHQFPPNERPAGGTEYSRACTQTRARGWARGRLRLQGRSRACRARVVSVLGTWRDGMAVAGGGEQET
jgi:hypothetical protein